MRFCSNNVNFILATHFHKLCEIECINNLKNIKFMHLTVDFDTRDKTIIYGRKLIDGPGDNLYGIEIANYIIEDDLFIENAKNIRNIILNKNNEILTNKTSNYNSNLYMDKCIICGDNGIDYPLDTHHIKEQNTFDEYDINKDKLCNIVVLCKKHHDSVHNGNLEINGYIDTINGKKLDFKFKENNEKKVSNKKYNDDQIKIIKDLALELKDQQQFSKVIINELKKKSINISPSILNKIINNIY
jgi:DNA mismatch repair protein MutS